ncbi:MAG: hypothetical protein QOF39_1110 [Frankiales bacterium]|nr:hypothetical protein [Frankiales bacterium]
MTGTKPATCEPAAGDWTEAVGAGLVTVTMVAALIAVEPPVETTLTVSECGPVRPVLSQESVAAQAFSPVSQLCAESVSVPSA